VRSSKKHVVKAFGLKWVVMAVLVRVPWSGRVWALPFLTVLAPSAAAHKKANTPRAHKTSIDWVRQMIRVVRRWWPTRALVLVVDGGFAAVKLALACTAAGMEVTLVSRWRLDAGLYHLPPPRRPGQRGKPPKKGGRQRKLSEWAHRSDTPWQEIEVTWYRGLRRKLLV